MNTCKTRKWRGRFDVLGLRDNPRLCTNSGKIDEDYGAFDLQKDDFLKYSYTEGGSFDVGDNFGCVHHDVKP